MVESKLKVEATGELTKKRIRPAKWVWWALAGIALISEWLLDMCVQLVQVIHGGFEGAAKALQRKYNEYNN